MERLSKNYQDFIYLLACGLNSRKADASRASQMDFKALLKIAKHQNLVNVAYEPIKKICNDSAWIQAYEQGVRRSMLFDEESKHICEFLDSQKIWYAPLKGVVLQNFYPVYGMRQMNDHDFLFDNEAQIVIEKFMKNRGYTLERTRMHDAYSKEPIYHFEFHRNIQLKNVTDVAKKYFEDISTKLISKNNLTQKQLSLPDFYLHVVCHLINHLECSYGGLKFLCDIYVLLKYAFDQQKFDDCTKIAKTLEVFDAQENLRKLVLKLFSNEDMVNLKEQELIILKACINNGDQGNFQNYIKDKLKKEAKNPKELIRLAYLGIKTWGLKSIVGAIRKR